MPVVVIITGFVVLRMSRCISCLGGFFEEAKLLKNSVPASNSDSIFTSASNSFACMMLCLATEGCCFVSYITTSSVCGRYRRLTGFKPKISSSVWNLMTEGGCPCGWYSFGTSCFLIPGAKLNWEESLAYCHLLDANLAKVDTKSKDVFLRRVLKTMYTDLYEIIWMGGSDRHQEGTWLWETSGSPITGYSYWFKTNPNNEGGNGRDADCLCYGKWTWFRWHDCHCFYSGSLICEKEKSNMY